jgi:hypothetical protein
MPPAIVCAKNTLAPLGNHAVEPRHHLRERIGEALHAHGAALLDVRPVERVLGPGLECQLAQHLGGVGRARRCIQVKTRHEWHVDDRAPQRAFSLGQLVVVQRTQRVGLVAPPDGDADNRHASLAGFVHQAIGIAPAKQFTKQDEHVARTKEVVLRKVAQRNRCVHVPIIALGGRALASSLEQPHRSRTTVSAAVRTASREADRFPASNGLCLLYIKELMLSPEFP